MQDGEDADGVDAGAEKQELMQLGDEYSQLGAEDVVGGVRTRFRYREVLRASAWDPAGWGVQKDCPTP